MRSRFVFCRFFLWKDKGRERVLTTFPLFKLGFCEGQFEQTVVQHTSDGGLVHVLTNEHQHLLSVAVVVVPVRLIVRSGLFGECPWLPSTAAQAHAVVLRTGLHGVK